MIADVRPTDMAVNLVTNRVYASDWAGDKVSVIDCDDNTVVTTVPVGNEPDGVGVNPVTNMVYVANYLGDLSVINGADNTVVETVDVGAGPAGASVNPVTNRVYVANRNDDTVSVVTPNITTCVPSSAIRGQTLDVDITGSGTTFVQGTSEVTFSGPGITVNTITVTDSTHATANISIDPGTSATPRDVNVVTGAEVPDPLIGGFTVEYAAPTLASITPDHGVYGRTVTGARIAGTLFRGPESNITVQLTNGPDTIDGTVTGVTSTQVTADFAIPEDAVMGDWDLYLEHNDDHKNATLPGAFEVGNPVPAVSSISPNSATAGDPGFTLTVNGADFVAGSKVRWNGSERNTVYESQARLTASITAADIAAPGEANVTVVTPGPGGGVSNSKKFTVSVPSPVIGSITPASGPPGTVVTIKGSNFGTGPAGSGGASGGAPAPYVSFNGVKATSYPKWTNTQIQAIVPDGAGAGPVLVVTSAGSSAKNKTFNVASPTWYLAEGTTDYGFDTYISIENPNQSAVKARVTYMTTDGPKDAGEITLPALSQTTIDPRQTVGNTDFSTQVTCTTQGQSIAVDRTMTWTGPAALSPEAHSSVGVTSPNQTWYLPEGSSKWGFETWLLIQNPGKSDAACEITYMIEGKEPVVKQKTVKASSRASFSMAEDIGEADASIKVTSDVPVIPERAMYRNDRREGHDSIGTTSAAADYFLAEGTTAWGFTTYVLIQNPNPAAAKVSVTYMTDAGAVPHPENPIDMQPNSRKTIRVNYFLAGKDFSTQVHSDKPIIAERAMYWDNGSGEACHDSIGMSMPHKTFYLPDGQSSDGKETYTLIQNPNETEVTVEVSYLTPDGKGNVTKTEKIAASSRKTFNMAEHSGIMGRASITVTCKSEGKKIMCERAMYWNNRGAGTDTIGGYSD